MDIKLFLSTFLLIFLAELGDKTQLTAMARAAGSDGGKWTVFVAAGAALVFSTLLAVLFGHLLSRVVPEHVIKILAGSLFLLFGALLLINAIRSTTKPAMQPAGTAEAPGAGMMVRAILHIAADFEEAAAADYASLATETQDPRIRNLLLELEAEEKQHLALMRTDTEHATERLADVVPDILPPGDALQHDVAQSDQPILAHAMKHEQATAAFYRELAERTPIPALQRTFAFLAQAEEEHVRKIATLQSNLYQNV